MRHNDDDNKAIKPITPNRWRLVGYCIAMSLCIGQLVVLGLLRNLESGLWPTYIALLLFLHVMSTAITVTLIRKHNCGKPTLYSVLFIMLCLPIAGVLLILMMQHQSQNSTDEKNRRDWQALPLGALPQHAHSQHLFPRQADPIYILKNASDTARKLKALDTATHLPVRRAVPIFRQAMLDDNDEVRLMGQSQFKRIEQQLNVQITQAKQLYEQAHTARSRAQSALMVALRYFDFIYLQVADPALEAHYLEQAEHYCTRALASQNLPEASLLAARIALIKQQSELAQDHLASLAASDFPPQQIRAYLAECAFTQGAYEHTATLLTDLSTQSPTLEKVRRFWL